MKIDKFILFVGVVIMTIFGYLAPVHSADRAAMIAGSLILWFIFCAVENEK